MKRHLRFGFSGFASVRRRLGGSVPMAAWAMLLALFPAGAPRAALGLGPQEVLVIVNANAGGSEALGKYYCLSRNILPERMVVLKTTANYLVARTEYNAALRDPVRKFIADNRLQDKIKCLTLMWGVPVRVSGTELTPAQRALYDVYKAMAEKMEGRLAIDSDLLKTVGMAFPQPRTAGLTPLSDLFEQRVSPTKVEPGSYGTLWEAFTKDLNARDTAAAAIKDRPQRQIALRQLLALRLDVLGTHKLPDCLPKESIAGVPTKDELEQKTAQCDRELAKLSQLNETPAVARQVLGIVMPLRGLHGVYEYCQNKMSALDTSGEDAATDSELALLWEGDDNLKMMRPNPMYWRLPETPRQGGVPERMLMTARVDGPTAKDALRIIKDGIETEKTGLKGTFYVDAGGRYPNYDEHLKRVAEFVKKATRFPVVLDAQQALFAPGACPNAALYVGWYSLRQYAPAFTWVKGSVGWHVASFEAEHLRDPNSNEWCVKMIQNGVAATVGAVNEPFLGSFPLPEDFFALLLTGRFTIAECYWRTVPAASWRLTLIADPLYNPFQLNPQVSVVDLPAALTARTPATARAAATTRAAMTGTSSRP